VLFDGIDFEKNYDDSKQHWSAIQPIEWVSERLYVATVSGVTNTSITNKVDAFTLMGTGKIYLGDSTNSPWIQGLGITNIMFGAGTNRAIFGDPW